MGPGDNVDTQDTDANNVDSGATAQGDYGNVMFNVGDTTWGIVDAQDDVVVFNPLTEP